jgi:hypothetical protein
MAVRRKLFLTHAGELAHRLVRAVRPDGLVARFAHSFAQQNSRRGVVDSAERIAELEAILGREVLLVMVTEVRRLLPGVLGAGKGRVLGPEEAAFAEAFWPEFMASLGRAFDWPAADAAIERAAFERDLLMYARRTGPSNPIQAPVSPFWDRCALLLDPAMMEEARAASIEFEKEAIRTAGQILGRLGRTEPHTAHAATPRRQARAGALKNPLRARQAGKQKPKRTEKPRRRS